MRVRVTPRVRIASAQAGQVQGTELPALPGAPVRIERQGADLRWTSVATGAVDTGGRFTLHVVLVPGAAYRAVVTPGHGYWRGVSPPVTAAG